ncbi:MAG: hypothetical protein HYV63_21265 [Candidatus Schekmanbacteria bacterium]|nr:hypothetical protein [Candidatus Schekmanbacteria bacterium]
MTDTAAGSFVEQAACLLEDLGVGSAFLSPADVALLEEWEQKGATLEILERGARAVLDREQAASGGAPAKVGRKRKIPLSKVRRHVEERIRLARVVGSGRWSAELAPASDAAPDASPLDAWRRALDAARASLAPDLFAALDEALSAVAAVVQAGALCEEVCTFDEAVDAILLRAAPEGIRAQAERDTQARLARYRGHLRPDALAAAGRRELADALRRAFALPRLTALWITGSR